MITRAVLATVLALCFVSADAYACGDSLYRVGKGVSYRTYSAPLPGNLLVFAPTDAAKQLALALSASGHGVQTVSSIAELESELETGSYDVVIAPYSEHTMIESAVASDSSADTSFLPVALTPEDEKLAKQTYDRVMVPEKHEIKHYLKAIHITLKSAL